VPGGGLGAESGQEDGVGGGVVQAYPVKDTIFYLHKNYHKMKPSIFHVFYSLHRTYPKIFTIFRPAYNFLHKFKHKAYLTQKGKEKQHCANAAGPLSLGPSRPTGFPCHARALLLSRGH
jgi:hypothetical protein